MICTYDHFCKFALGGANAFCSQAGLLLPFFSCGLSNRRDSSAYISVYESVFHTEYIQNRESRLPLNIDELALVPYSESNKLFKIESGNIEKGKVIVHVFEVSTDFASFMDGIDADNKGINLQKPLMVGSMVEPKVNGNWGE